MIRMKYTFYGNVQGVGFRYRAYHAAQSLGLSGWVRNEYDGSVMMEVQGLRQDIDAMLDMIENGHYISIDSMDSKEIAVDLNESSFGIDD